MQNIKMKQYGKNYLKKMLNLQMNKNKNYKKYLKMIICKSKKNKNNKKFRNQNQ